MLCRGARCFITLDSNGRRGSTLGPREGSPGSQKGKREIDCIHLMRIEDGRVRTCDPSVRSRIRYPLRHAPGETPSPKYPGFIIMLRQIAHPRWHRGSHRARFGPHQGLGRPPNRTVPLAGCLNGYAIAEPLEALADATPTWATHLHALRSTGRCWAGLASYGLESIF